MVMTKGLKVMVTFLLFLPIIAGGDMPITPYVEQSIFFVPASIAVDLDTTAAIVVSEKLQPGPLFDTGVDTQTVETWMAPRSGEVQISPIIYPHAVGGGDIYLELYFRKSAIGDAFPGSFYGSGGVHTIVGDGVLVPIISENLSVDEGDFVELVFVRLGTAVDDTFAYGIQFLGFQIEYV